MTKKLFVIAIMTTLLAGCTPATPNSAETNKNAETTTSVKINEMTKTEKTMPTNQDEKSREISNQDEKMPKEVVLHTTEGDITIKLLPESAPRTVESFWKLARDGKYDNVPFHRVIKDFMIQTGDYENHNGTGGKSWFGTPMKNEIDPKLSHKRGMVSMANAGPDTNGSQFFIVHKDSAFLDGNYSIFGEVIKGMDVVDKIAETKTMPGDRPVQEIDIKNTDLKF